MAFAVARPMRALTDDPDFGSAPQLFCCNVAPVQRVAGGDVHSPLYLFESAGAAFAARFDFPHRSSKEGQEAGSADSDEEGESEEGEEYGRSRGPKEKATGSFKLSDILKGVDLYGLLGVPEGASQDEIKKAYRGCALSHHPDKQAMLEPAEAKTVQERFVQIQEAYELLSDSAKRMQYDSSLDFDDSLPKFKPDSGEDFFEVFGEAFRRNARFSTRRPVPSIGTADTSPQEWKRFYNFWHEFQSWRDPLVLAQKEGEELCDLNEAESREEKRWMMRENARVSKAYKQAERDRVGDLVRLAEKFDPRIIAEKEAKKAAREAEMARRAEERAAVQRAKEEAERIKREAEEEVKRQEAEKRKEEKAAREAVKAQLKKCRQRLRSFHPQVKSMVLIDQLNEVCLQFEESALKTLSDQVEAALKRDVASAAAVMHKAIESLGLTPVTFVKAEEDAQSTSSGPSSEADPQVLEEQRQRQAEQERRRKQAEEKRKEEEAAKAEERARMAAEKAEQKKVRDEQRRKEQLQQEAKKRQMEKKEEEKAKKAEEKRQKQEEEEAQRREKQREEARQNALVQAERDRAAAAAAKEEQDAERIAQLFAADRLDRLGKLDHMTDQDLAAELDKGLEEDTSVAAAMQLLQRYELSEVVLDMAMGLLYKVNFVWPLGLNPPATIRLPNAVRNRVKKARLRLRDAASALLSRLDPSAGAGAEVSEWQQGIADGTIESPVWTIEEKEAEDQAAKEAQAKDKPKEVEGQPAPAGKKGKKNKEPKEPKGEEDLDELLAEFGVSPVAPASKKSGGGKKKK